MQVLDLLLSRPTRAEVRAWGMLGGRISFDWRGESVELVEMIPEHYDDEDACGYKFREDSSAHERRRQECFPQSVPRWDLAAIQLTFTEQEDYEQRPWKLGKAERRRLARECRQSLVEQVRHELRHGTQEREFYLRFDSGDCSGFTNVSDPSDLDEFEDAIIEMLRCELR